MKPEPPTRISITFSADAVAWLEHEAAKRATSVSDLVRRVVDESRGDFVVVQRTGQGRTIFPAEKSDSNFTYKSAELPET